jgi:hypothetical protein
MLYHRFKAKKARKEIITILAISLAGSQESQLWGSSTLFLEAGEKVSRNRPNEEEQKASTPPDGFPSLSQQSVRVFAGARPVRAYPFLRLHASTPT